MAVVRSAVVGLADAESVVISLLPGLRFALVQRFDVAKFANADSVQICDWDNIRWFGELTELRCARRGDVWAILLLSDDESVGMSGFDHSAAAERYRSSERWQLWGERDGDRFADPRLPSPVFYPIAGTGRVAVEVARYCVDGEVMPSLVRYVRLVQEED